MDLSFVSKTALFKGISENEISHLLKCLNAYEKHFSKNEIIYYAGDTASDIGLILNGSVNIIINYYWGTSSILGHIEKGEIFAETYAALGKTPLICDVVSDCNDCNVLFFSFKSFLSTCGSDCSYHKSLIENLLRLSAGKNLSLSEKIFYTAAKSIRGRLLSYLSAQSAKVKSLSFEIPFSRQQLADYLNVDRSALSNELGKMQREGILNFHKNKFTLISDKKQKSG